MESHIYSRRAQEGRKRLLTSSSATAEVTEEPEQGSPHQLHYHCQRVSSQHFPGQQEHSATGILFWKLETQESVWGGDSSLSTSEGPAGPNHIAMEHGAVGPSSPSAQANPHLPQTSLRTTAFVFMVATQGRYSYSQLPPLYAPSRLFFTML